MRQPHQAAEDATFSIVQTIEDLQDADAPNDLIDEAERLQSSISEWAQDSFPSGLLSVELSDSSEE